MTLVRIDDRLIHGQVVEGWLPSLGVARVVVVSDSAAADATQAALMQLALPDSVGLEIRSVREAPAAVRAAQESKDRVLVLAPGPAEVLALLQDGVRLESVNVGGLHYAAGRMQLGKAMFLGGDDMRALEGISGFGTRLEGRAVPGEPPVDILALIRERG